MTRQDALTTYARSVRGRARAALYIEIVRRFLGSGVPLTRAGITRYAKGLVAGGMAPSSVDLHVRTIKRMCAVIGVPYPGSDWSWDRKANPSQRIAALPDFVAKLVQQAPRAGGRVTAWMILSTLYGCRASELAMWSAKDLGEEDQIFIRRVKEGESRWYWLPPQLKPILKAGAPRPMPPRETYEEWHRLLDAAHTSAPSGTAFHAIRRGLVVGLRGAGLPDPDVRRFVAWSGDADEDGLDMVRLYGDPTGYLDAAGIVHDQVAPADPKKLDAAAWTAHPFLDLWSA